MELLHLHNIILEVCSVVSTLRIHVGNTHISHCRLYLLLIAFRCSEWKYFKQESKCISPLSETAIHNAKTHKNCLQKTLWICHHSLSDGTGKNTSWSKWLQAGGGLSKLCGPLASRLFAPHTAPTIINEVSVQGWLTRPWNSAAERPRSPLPVPVPFPGRALLLARPGGTAPRGWHRPAAPARLWPGSAETDTACHRRWRRLTASREPVLAERWDWRAPPGSVSPGAAGARCGRRRGLSRTGPTQPAGLTPCPQPAGDVSASLCSSLLPWEGQNVNLSDTKLHSLNLEELWVLNCIECNRAKIGKSGNVWLQT